eukprot:9668633-Karenia_brevis.AAC.1
MVPESPREAPERPRWFQRGLRELQRAPERPQGVADRHQIVHRAPDGSRETPELLGKGWRATHFV